MSVCLKQRLFSQETLTSLLAVMTLYSQPIVTAQHSPAHMHCALYASKHRPGSPLVINISPPETA